MAVDYEGLLDDLTAEGEELAALLEPIAEADWDHPTPAPGWTVRDQVSHIAYFDRVTCTAATDEEAFGLIRDEALVDLEAYVDVALEPGQSKSGPEMVSWLRQERADLVAAFSALDPTARVPWFGPSMSVVSKATARIMETWAHGQDVVDALGLVRIPTDRLAHVCQIGARAFPNSFRARGRDVPDAPVWVSLELPSGAPWTFGEPDAEDTVIGSALDFCLVVTQRRHVADSGLAVTGPVAGEWMEIAQAFAGPPGEGREPGQFN